MKKSLIIVLIVIVIISIITSVLLIFKPHSSNNDSNIKLIPFVEENNIEILSADKVYSNPVNIYTVNDKNDKINLEGINFNSSKAEYKFYDYNVSKEDENGYVTFSFKYDTTVPIKYTDNKKNQIKWFYTYSIVSPIIFDYYTGDCYDKKIINSNKNVVSFDGDGKENTDNEKMKYTEISWDNKTYKIGVGMEINSSKWDGNKLVEDKNGVATYADTDRLTTTINIYAPKDYDGLMIAVLKRGSSKESFEIQNNEYEKLLKLQKEAEESGEKSEELIKIEEKRNKIYKLFESTYDENLKYNKDDYDIIRVNNIKSKEK